MKHFGRLDVLINNHGASITTPSFNLSPNGWRAVVGINLDGMFFCSKAAARQFIKQGDGGSIINISSTAGVHGSHDDAALWRGESGRRQPDDLACRRMGLSMASG